MKAATLTEEQLKQCWIEAYLLDPAKYSPYAFTNTDPAFLQALAVTITRALAAEGDLKQP